MITEPERGQSAESGGEEYVLSLRDLFQVVWQRLWVIALVVILLTGLAVGLSLSQTPQYEASIKILVGQQRGITESPTEALGLQELTQTMAEAVDSRRIALAVIDRLDLDVSEGQFSGSLSAEQIPDTQFILVRYTDTDPEQAQRVVNAVGDEFSEQIAEVGPGANAITATVWDRAAVPAGPVSPTPLRNGLLTMAIAVMLGVGLAFLIEYMYESWRSPEEAEQVSGVPIFGIIPEFEGARERKKGRV